MSDRTEIILGTADALFGAITMPVVAALLPEVAPANLRRLMHKLVTGGAVVPAWTTGTGKRVWLTTRSAAGRVAGIRKWVADSDAVRAALLTKTAGTLQPPVTFVHAQQAGLVVAGFGTHGRQFDSELHVGEVGPIADGIAYPEPSLRLLVEVERMVRQGPGRWEKAGGLLDKITAGFAESAPGDLRTQHLVVAPKRGSVRGTEAVDFEQELAALVTGRATKLAGVPTTAGWWFLSLDEPETDPVWHPVFNGSPKPLTLPGIAKRRDAYAGAHAKFARQDQERKARKRAQDAGVSLPAGITVLPVERVGAVPTEGTP